MGKSFNFNGSISRILTVAGTVLATALPASAYTISSVGAGLTVSVTNADAGLSVSSSVSEGVTLSHLIAGGAPVQDVSGRNLATGGTGAKSTRQADGQSMQLFTDFSMSTGLDAPALPGNSYAGCCGGGGSVVYDPSNPAGQGILWGSYTHAIFDMTNTSATAQSISFSLDYVYDLFAEVVYVGESAYSQIKLYSGGQTWATSGANAGNPTAVDGLTGLQLTDRATSPQNVVNISKRGGFSGETFSFDVAAGHRTQFAFALGVELSGASVDPGTNAQQLPHAPLPAGVWMMLSALGLMGIGRRLRSQGD